MANEIQDMSTKYDGRVVRLEIFVNTNENIHEVTHRVKKASRGQVRNAVIVMGSLYTGENGRKIWKTIQEISVDVAKNPKAVNFDENGKPL
jgi:folylpolyglutamate synthase/dihydropteroate synthase